MLPLCLVFGIFVFRLAHNAKAYKSTSYSYSFAKISQSGLCVRYHSRFFVRVGYETTYADIEKKIIIFSLYHVIVRPTVRPTI